MFKVIKVVPDRFSFLVDLLSCELIPRVIRLINSCLSSSNDIITEQVLESKPETMFWLRMMESIRDPYTMERISEQILHQLVTHHANDVQAYWVLWLLFHRLFKLRASVRWVGNINWFCLYSQIILTQSPIWIEGEVYNWNFYKGNKTI